MDKSGQDYRNNTYRCNENILKTYQENVRYVWAYNTAMVIFDGCFSSCMIQVYITHERYY